MVFANNYLFVLERGSDTGSGMDTVCRIETGLARPVQVLHLKGIYSIDRNELRSSGVYAEYGGESKGGTDRFHQSEKQRV